MCCLFTSLVILGPRAAIVIWWLLQPVRWDAAFDTFLVPFLGLLFLPWTTLIYVGVSPGGVTDFDIVWIAFGVFIDVAQWIGGAWGNRAQIQTTYNTRWG